MKIPKILYIENFLSDKECDDLISLYHNTPDTNNSDDTIWSGRGRWPVYPENLHKKLTIDELSTAEFFFNKKFSQDNLHLMRWDVGHEMRPHNDLGGHNEFAHRHYASIVYLNDNYVGGDLYIPKFDINIKPKKGLFVCFEGSKIEHGVSKIEEGTRFTSICWFTEII